MRIARFSPNAWLDYIYWQKSDRNVQKRIDQVVKGLCENSREFLEISKGLKFELSEVKSIRIDMENRLVYRITNGAVQIIQCRYHY